MKNAHAIRQDEDGVKLFVLWRRPDAKEGRKRAGEFVPFVSQNFFPSDKNGLFPPVFFQSISVSAIFFFDLFADNKKALTFAPQLKKQKVEI